MTELPTHTGWFWCRDRVATPGIVEIPMPYGGRWWADVLAPRVCVAFHAPSMSALAGLAALFGKAWRDTVIEDAPLPADSVAEGWAPAPVPEGWARLVVARGVRRWMPYPVDERVLPIDEAIGWHLAGHPEMAALALAPVANVLVDLIAAQQGGMLPQSACLDVEFAVTIAKDVLAESNPDRLDIEAAQDSGPAEPSLSDEDLSAVLADWAGRLFALEPVGALALRPEDSEPNRELIDLRSVAARILAWRGPEHRELRAVAVPNGIRVDSFLAEDVEPSDWEVTQLRVYAARRDTGEVLGSAPLVANGDATSTGLVSAHITLDPSADLESIVVGIGQDDIPARPRLDPAGQTLLDVDRRILGAWASHRLDQVGRGESSEQSEHGELAESAVGRSPAADHLLDAQTLLDFPASSDGVGRGEIDVLREVAGRRIALAQHLFGEDASKATAHHAPVDRPLLAEIVPGLPGLASFPSFRR
ncbi:MAG: hypothetical protein IPM08_01425 [Actinomycetales bacterium]|nr:hypothetical protein [Actinomycetales bacterium]